MARRQEAAKPGRHWLAAGFAVLLAITPVARPSLPAAPMPAPAGSGLALAAAERAIAPAPAARVRPAQPVDFGVLARWSWLETKPGLSPPPPAAGRPRVGERPPALASAIRAQGGNPRGRFHPSSVGSARRPTGPPAPASA